MFRPLFCDKKLKITKNEQKKDKAITALLNKFRIWKTTGKKMQGKFNLKKRAASHLHLKILRCFITRSHKLKMYYSLRALNCIGKWVRFIQCPFALFNQILVQGVEDFINKKIFTNTPKCIATLNADFQYIWPILLIIKFINNKPRSVALIFRCTVYLLLAINLSFAWEKRLRDWF